LRFRAEEARTVADQMIHEAARTIMRRIAMDYDRLAKLAEEQLADQERGARFRTFQVCPKDLLTPLPQVGRAKPSVWAGRRVRALTWS
jgi:hypothetical protein